VNNPNLHPDAPRIVLKRLIRESGMKQKVVADAVGEREDTFSNKLNGKPHAVLDAPLVINTLNAIGVDFVVYARYVEKESKRLYATDGN
jgi:hypothetical protein